MNERINGLWWKARIGYNNQSCDPEVLEKFAELIVRECVGILETEIELVEGYKSTACNDFDVRWHDGKIVHFTKLIEKSKKHFGVEE
jgi:hypothetical protein